MLQSHGQNIVSLHLKLATWNMVNNRGDASFNFTNIRIIIDEYVIQALTTHYNYNNNV